MHLGISPAGFPRGQAARAAAAGYDELARQALDELRGATAALD